MPVYEFYCRDCHTIYNFYSSRVNTEKRPPCPRCERPELERRVSVFAISKGREESEEGDLPDLDEERLEQAMMALAGEAESMDEEDPRQMARLMRKLYGATGMELGEGMEEAIRRMEAGEDPDKIEEEMGDVLEGEDPFSGETAKRKLKQWRREHLPPNVDETLYPL